MKYSILLLTLGLIFFSACNDDDDFVDPENQLSYDGDNSAAPELPAGIYEAAVLFPQSITQGLIGRTINEVRFFMGDIPSTTRILISEAGNANAPGAIAYAQNVSLNTPGSWNTIALDTPYEIDGTDLWISLEVNHSQAIQSVGCDAGPAVGNGDFIYEDASQTWSSFRSYTSGGADINWNIRAILN